ncbi:MULTISPECIES: hypothetical protein [Acinetobacter]|uniref:hypothetical protein n=1 Tax=Acinetobacter TaxID=469 RepID=UPI00028ED1BB|nr:MULTISPECIES: hypothetical protein [Acinetobacter]MDP7849757.1 hypothetical protein [Acinetobacter baumannii]BBL22154.1 hypothetical protein ACRAD_28250 [Acinetobacter radioresistens DSM 6976 = NBRC 102413 = CIP 103788]
MQMKYQVVSLVLLGLINCVSYAEVNPSAPNYSENEKQKNIQRLRELATQSQAETIQSASNYNKAMFDAARQGYGGYSDINVEFDINDRGLSSAERASIENTRRNAAIMKEQLKGLK